MVLQGRRIRVAARTNNSACFEELQTVHQTQDGQPVDEHFQVVTGVKLYLHLPSDLRESPTDVFFWTNSFGGWISIDGQPNPVSSRNQTNKKIILGEEWAYMGMSHETPYQTTGAAQQAKRMSKKYYLRIVEDVAAAGPK